MDDIQREYQEAYKEANSKDIRVRKVTVTRYMLPQSNSEFTAKQMKGFIKGLRRRRRIE